jgi:SAM-dependent methyltransferase
MFYDEDLAYVHDAGFGDLARDAASTVIELLKRQKIKSGLIADLGCGSGILAQRLTHAGFDVIGIDVSEAMLKIARRRAPKARFRRMSLFLFDLPSCVAVTAIGESINYLFDSDTSDQLTNFFGRVHRALVPGGIFVLDVAASGRASKAMLHSEDRDWAILVSKEEDARQRVLTRRMTIFRKIGRHYRRSEETHRQRLYPATQIVRELGAAGFQVTHLSGYGKHRFASGHAGFIACKK